MSGREETNLKAYEELQEQARKLREEQDAVIAEIRNGFTDLAIIFMDVVGSTAFKTAHADTPERWILRVRQFSLMLAKAINTAGGRVVKYIGDEVMGVFDDVLDAQNLLGRIDRLQRALTEATGAPTEIKVAVDYGRVYRLKFEGHDEADPMGSAVDRCARIGKFSLPGQVLASQAFAEKTSTLAWKPLGTAELKGLGQQTIYQLGHATADISPKIEIPKHEYEELRRELDESRVKIPRLIEQNKQLQEQIVAIGAKPSAAASAVEDGSDDAISTVDGLLNELRSVISGAPGLPAEYASFVFRHIASKPGLKPNRYAGQTYDALITASLIESPYDNGVYELEPGHKRNQKVISLVRALESALIDHLRSHEPPEEDLFDWSVHAAEYWSKYIGFTVV